MAVNAVFFAAVAWSFVAGFRTLLTRRRAVLRGEPTPQRTHKSAAWPMGGLTTVGSVFVVGVAAALMGESFSRYLSPDEAHAVGSVRRWYDEHPQIPDTQRPKQFRANTASSKDRLLSITGLLLMTAISAACLIYWVPAKPRVYDVRNEASSTDHGSAYVIYTDPRNVSRPASRRSR